MFYTQTRQRSNKKKKTNELINLWATECEQERVSERVRESMIERHNYL